MSSSGTPRGSEQTPDFGALAESYDRLRPVDENWEELLELVIELGDLRGRRVLEIGCGTGRVAAALADRGARVWGVDPSEEMLAVARTNVGKDVGLRRASAEALPFRDAWFERAVLRLVVHLIDRRIAFAELARVLRPSGRAVVATFEPRSFAHFWASRFFPRVEQIDLERFPSPDALARELRAAGFSSVELTRLVQEATLTRDQALERIRGRYISTLRLLPEDEYREGLARAERDLPDEIPYRLDWAVLVAERT